MTPLLPSEGNVLEGDRDSVPGVASETHTTTNQDQPQPGPAELAELSMGDPHFMDTAYAVYADLHAKGPVTRVRFAGRDAATADDGAAARSRLFPPESFFVTHYDEVVTTLLSDRYSVDPSTTMAPQQREQQPAAAEELRLFSRNLLSLDPPDHTRLRKLVQPSFTGRAMEALQGRIQQIVDNLLDRAEREAAERGEAAPNRHMDLIEAFAYPMPVTVISDMLGIPPEDRATIRGWTEHLLRADRRRGRELDEEARAGLREFTTYLRALLVRKRQRPADDMISQLVYAEQDGDTLAEDDILSMVFLLFLAGHVTTVNLIGNGVVALLTHPAQLALLRADIGLAKGAVEETLRYWGPVDFVGRRFAKEDIELCGVTIPKGELITVGLAAANRDPEQFEHPDVFDITRAAANRHVAFGKGIHVCLGAPLARVEGQIAFSTLFRRVPQLRLAVPPEDVQWGRNFLRGFARLPVLF